LAFFLRGELLTGAVSGRRGDDDVDEVSDNAEDGLLSKANSNPNPASDKGTAADSVAAYAGDASWAAYGLCFCSTIDDLIAGMGMVADAIASPLLS
jgi:hypothetical protein